MTPENEHRMILKEVVISLLNGLVWGAWRECLRGGSTTVLPWER